MSLVRALRDDGIRRDVAADAVVEAGSAVRSRRGLSATAAIVGFETIVRLRPGFLELHIHAMLPDLAHAIEPHWRNGVEHGTPHDHLVAHAEVITIDLLAVTDAYVDNAQDAKAIAVYQQLRSRAPRRIAEQMPRIALFIERHTPPN